MTQQAIKNRKPCILTFATEAETEQQVIELTIKKQPFRVTGRKSICIY